LTILAQVSSSRNKLQKIWTGPFRKTGNPVVGVKEEMREKKDSRRKIQTGPEPHDSDKGQNTGRELKSV